MKKLVVLLFVLLNTVTYSSEPLRIMFIGAHIDEAEAFAGGTLALYSKMGHKIKILSLTNSNLGHGVLGGHAIVKKRMDEAAKVSGILNAEYDVVDIPDGELEADIRTRKLVIRKIREFEPDVVITFTAEGWGHPDIRAAGKLVHDASCFVPNTPNICPTVKAMDKSPLYLIVADYASHERVKSDIVICIDEVFDTKVKIYYAHKSQDEFSNYRNGITTEITESFEEQKQKLINYHNSIIGINDIKLKALKKYYGGSEMAKMQFFESFEIAPYNIEYSDKELKNYFPMFD